jgi:hypothetical protein
MNSSEKRKNIEYVIRKQKQEWEKNNMQARGLLKGTIWTANGIGQSKRKKENDKDTHNRSRTVEPWKEWATLQDVGADQALFAFMLLESSLFATAPIDRLEDEFEDVQDCPRFPRGTLHKSKYNPHFFNSISTLRNHERISTTHSQRKISTQINPSDTRDYGCCSVFTDHGLRTQSSWLRSWISWSHTLASLSAGEELDPWRVHSLPSFDVTPSRCPPFVSISAAVLEIHKNED